MGGWAEFVLNRPRGPERPRPVDDPRPHRHALQAWRDNPHIHAVVIEDTGDRAFCAGGDIRALRQHQLDNNRAPVDAFFTEEYALNRMIDRPTPSRISR